MHEGYGELSIPIVSGLPFADDVEARLAAARLRLLHVRQRLDLQARRPLAPFPDVTVRGTYSTAFRAPTITELYLGQFDNFPSVSDPCAILRNAQCDAEDASNNGTTARPSCAAPTAATRT